MNLLLYGVVSTLLTAAVIANAWNQRPQFYTACQYISRSQLSILVLYNMFLCAVIGFGKLMQQLFFGNLRAIEVEHMYERGWYAVTDVFLIMTIFRDEFDIKFAIYFTLFMFMKVFHWLAKDRVDFMEQSQIVTNWFHVRMNFLFILLLALDAFGVRVAAFSLATHGHSVMIMFGFEYAILALTLVSTFIKYVLHTIDLRSQAPWESKSTYIFYVDLIFDLLRLITYGSFFAMIVTYYGVPLHIVRDLYMTFRSFVQRVYEMIQYRRVTANMNERYPDATPEELSQVDRTCIICRDEMLVAKRLPCGHLFHFQCLRSWLERQQTCPTCRRPLLTDGPAPAVGDIRAGVNIPGQQAAADFQPNFGLQADGPQPMADAAGHNFGHAALRRAAGNAAPQQPPHHHHHQHHQHHLHHQQQRHISEQSQPAGSIPSFADQDTSQARPAVNHNLNAWANRILNHGPFTASASSHATHPAAAEASSHFGSVHNAAGLPVTNPWASAHWSANIPAWSPAGVVLPPGGIVGAGLPGIMPPFSFSPGWPSNSTPPRASPLDHLTDEELQELEGSTRANILARIRYLQTVELELHNLMLRFAQYQSLVADRAHPATNSTAHATSKSEPQASPSSSSSSSSSSTSIASSSSSTAASQLSNHAEPHFLHASARIGSAASNYHGKGKQAASSVVAEHAGQSRIQHQTEHDRDVAPFVELSEQGPHTTAVESIRATDVTQDGVFTEASSQLRHRHHNPSHSTE